MRKTVIIGATPNTSWYAYMAAERLTNHKEMFVPVGNELPRGRAVGVSEQT